MKRLLILVMFSMFSCPAWAGVIQINSESDFLDILKVPYLFEDFSGYTYKSFVDYSLPLSENGYQATLSAPRKLYSLDGSMSTKWNNDPLIIDVAGSPLPVTAIGGYFWPSDMSGQSVSGSIKFTLSDGTDHVVQIDQANSSTFLGFGTNGTAFARLEIIMIHDDPNEPTWPTLDNLYVGSDPPKSVPEPSALLLLIMGLGGVGASFWRKGA